MALSTPYVPTGEFVPVRVWSCTVHDDDANDHYCDCDRCGYEIECLDCAVGEWRDKRDTDGNVVMRELTVWELGFRKMWKDEGGPAAIASMLGKKIAWLEDEVLPCVDNYKETL
jgi:hypothetical protein